jgi:hypothetical protein
MFSVSKTQFTASSTRATAASAAISRQAAERADRAKKAASAVKSASIQVSVPPPSVKSSPPSTSPSRRIATAASTRPATSRIVAAADAGLFAPCRGTPEQQQQDRRHGGHDQQHAERPRVVHADLHGRDEEGEPEAGGCERRCAAASRELGGDGARHPSAFAGGRAIPAQTARERRR